MSNAASASDTTPLLRMLSPALRGLERSLRNWLDATHRYPLSTLHRAALGHIEQIAGNLETMPPKSTYFYPKLLTGLVFNALKVS